jgi:hypothetical protein
MHTDAVLSPLSTIVANNVIPCSSNACVPLTSWWRCVHFSQIILCRALSPRTLYTSDVMITLRIFAVNSFIPCSSDTCIPLTSWSTACVHSPQIILCRAPSHACIPKSSWAHWAQLPQIILYHALPIRAYHWRHDHTTCVHLPQIIVYNTLPTFLPLTSRSHWAQLPQIILYHALPIRRPYRRRHDHSSRFCRK